MNARQRVGAQPRIAFVQDVLLAPGGAEKLLAEACLVFPQAEIYTLAYRSQAFPGWPFAGRRVHTSFLDRLPGVRSHHRLFFPIMPRAIERFDLAGYDVVVSFSYAVAHGVRVPAGQRHLAYIHTPMRYAWRMPHPLVQGLERRLPPAARFLGGFLDDFRQWDRTAAARPQALATVSHWMASCIDRIYGREANVIYPPVEVDLFRPQRPRQDYYLSLGRLVHHKRLDLVIQAFNRLGLPLQVVGEGPERQRLQRMAGPNITFLGWQPQLRLAGLLGQARAFVHAGEEDFGIAMAEAQAAGCPVIAYARGAASEIVLDGLTGLLFAEQSVDGLACAVTDMERRPEQFDPLLIQASARRFDRRRFHREFHQFVMGMEMPGLADELFDKKWLEAGFPASMPGAPHRPSHVETRPLS
jgi:glycosyltransferase involved in cell wall biosynthesis